MKENLNFGEALALLKQGKRVSRQGWNGKGMFIFLVPGTTFKVYGGIEINYHAHIVIKTVDGQIVPWVASQTDVLAEDWREVT